jgi:phi13 family phage major tail protein
MGEPSQVGLDMFHYAEQLTDTSSGCSYDSPAAVTGIIAANVKANGSIETQYADDGPASNAASVGRQEVSLEFTGLAPTVRADWLGHTTTSGVVQEKTTDIPKVVAIGFRSQKANGNYRYVWYLKGQFAVPDDKYETKKERTVFGTTSLTYAGLRRDYDKEYKVWADDDDPAVPASVITNWFNAVPITIASPDALTLTTDPEDTDADVLVSANVTFTYNNALKDSQLTDDYFYLVKASDGSKVAAALSIDTTSKVVTLNPTSNLEASTDYIAVASGLVADIYGQKLAAGTTIINFTTAA